MLANQSIYILEPCLNKMDTDTPIPLGYDGLGILQVEDQILYKIGVDKHFVPAQVTQEPGSTGVYIRLLKDYRGKNTQFQSGDEILAGAQEVFWDRQIKLPQRLEDVLSQ